MLEGDPPYINEETTNIIKLVKGIGKPFFKTYFKLSKELKSFIDSCLKVDSNKRASARELKEHEFLDSDMEVVTAPYVKK
jgi:serine/threonine protein kinase